MSKKLVFLSLFASIFFMNSGMVCASFVDFANIVSTFDFSSVFGVMLDSVSNIFFLAAEDTQTLTSSVNTEIVARRVGSGLATAGLGGVGTGIGLVFSGLIKGFSWNPSLKDDLFSYAIFGFALTEAMGLFALMIAFMLLYA